VTRSPSEDRRSEGVDGPHYQLNAVCVVPGCNETRSLQRHHLWRKSDLIGDKWWVRTKDGLLHGNCVRVCGHHHRDLTDNVAAVVYRDETFWWRDVLGEALPLDWQPPGEALYQELSAPERETPSDPDLLLTERLGASHVLVEGHDPDVCPTCLRKLPRPKDERAPEAKKVRKTYSVAVPMDRWEDGAAVIDTLMDEAQKELARFGLPYGEGKVVKYYILTAALGMFVTHAGSLMDDN
jgi:hypothetical protein